MNDLVDLPAPNFGGTYFVLVEPEVLKIGTSNCISSRVSSIRSASYRRVAFLAWTKFSEKQVHSRFESERITYLREFFKLSSRLLSFINECRVELGYSSLEEVQLWEFGGSLPRGNRVEISHSLSSAWDEKLKELPTVIYDSLIRILKTERFRSERRRELKGRVIEWLLNSDLDIKEFLTFDEMNILRGSTLKGPREVDPEELSKNGRYYTHLRWHKKPKASCEFCNPLEPREG